MELECIRPCTPVQSGMLASFLKSEGSMYFNSMDLKVPESSDCLAKLRQAWYNVVEKHEILRTGFSMVNDLHHPFAMLTYHAGITNVNLEIREDILLGDREDLCERTSVMGKHVLRLLHQPPWRLEAIKRSKVAWTVRLFIHHALFDAASLQIILSDVAKYYRGDTPRPATAMKSTLDSILIASQNNHENKERFWRNMIGDVSITKFPCTTPLHVHSSKSFNLEKCIGISLCEIQQRCKELEVTVQAAGQAMWARMLSMYTGEPSIVFGSGLFYDQCIRSFADAVSHFWPNLSRK